MKRQLLLVTKFSFDDDDSVHRMELWRGTKYSIDEWILDMRGNWAQRPRRYCGEDLGQATEAYGEYVQKRGIAREGSWWLGVAVCLAAPESDKELLLNESFDILIEAYNAGITACSSNMQLLLHAFPAEFGTKLPRGIIGEGCWKIQFKGLCACDTCPFRGEKTCVGQDIAETGTNSVGIEIPILG